MNARRLVRPTWPLKSLDFWPCFIIDLQLNPQCGRQMLRSPGLTYATSSPVSAKGAPRMGWLVSGWSQDTRSRSKRTSGLSYWLVLERKKVRRLGADGPYIPIGFGVGGDRGRLLSWVGDKESGSIVHTGRVNSNCAEYLGVSKRAGDLAIR